MSGFETREHLPHGSEKVQAYSAISIASKKYRAEPFFDTPPASW
jgi:hypothetical protein